MIGRIAPDLSVLSQCAYIRPGGSGTDRTGTVVAGPFSLIYLVCNALFNLPSQERQVGCFRNVAKVLGPGGLFVIECFIQDLTEFDRGQRVATRALSGELAEVGFLAAGPVARAAAGRRGAFAARAPALRPLRLGWWWAGGLELGARRAGLRLPERS